MDKACLFNKQFRSFTSFERLVYALAFFNEQLRLIIHGISRFNGAIIRCELDIEIEMLNVAARLGTSLGY
jgi:hypothetical protein